MIREKSLVRIVLYLVFFSAMNITMFNVALPKIAQDFSLTPSQASWVIAGYGMVMAVGSTVYGKLTELFPPRRLFIAGLALFAAGSAAGLFAYSYPVVIIARLIQAAGAAAIPSIGMITISQYIPAERRGYALGLVASVVALSTGFGPVIGGVLTEYGNWRMLFLLSILSLTAIPFLLRLLPKDKPAGQLFDLLAAMLFLSGVVTLLMGISTNPYFLLGSVLLFGLFIVKNNRSSHPFIQMSLLKNRMYRVLLLIAFINFAVTFSVYLLLPLMLKEVYNLNESVIGLTLLPGSLAAAILGGSVGKLSDRFGSRMTIQWAALAMAAGFFMISSLIGLSPILIIGTFILVFLGFSSIQSGVSSFVSKILAPHEIGIGLGLYSLTSFLGGAFGPAMISRFIELDTSKWNPLASNSLYSNAFLLLMLGSLISAIMIISVQHKRQPLHSMEPEERKAAL